MGAGRRGLGTTRRAAWAGVAALLATGVALVPPHAQAAPPPPADTTSPVEVARVDAVPTPKIKWRKCYRVAQCATVALPLDYDDPDGRQVEIAIARRKARDPEHRIGSLFLNPGGPGGSGVGIALGAPYFLSKRLLNRFDMVGFDPRGTNGSTNVQCFKTNKQQNRVLSALLGEAFPFTPEEEATAVTAAEEMGRACSSSFAQPLSASMSTAEVARDMDVLRRAVGDDKLSYLGFSYGSYLGQVYANLFPDRVRAVTIDGVLDPVAWAGTPATAEQPQTDRLRSADGAWKALREILVRCKAAGKARCEFWSANPVQRLATIAERLKTSPLVDDGFEFGYDDMVGLLLGALYSPDGWRDVVEVLAQLDDATSPDSSPAARRAASARVAATDRKVESALRSSSRFAKPYFNDFEAFSGVLCTDGLNPAQASRWPAVADAADARAPYFGRLWLWAGPQCASSTWTAQDEDAYRGPFTKRTSSPVMVVGDYYDPATNYDGAVTAASLLPNSYLLSSDSWGHTAYGTSDCVTTAVDLYLLNQQLPPADRVCRGDDQPFEGTNQVQHGSELGKRAPVAPLVPGGVR